MIRRLPILTAAMVVALLSNQADAQFRRGATGGLGTRMASLSVEPTVQKEIEALDEQKEQLKAINDKVSEARRASFRGFGGRNRGGGGRQQSEAERKKAASDAQKKAGQLEKKVRGQLEEALLPHQFERLQEIAVRALGAGALQDSYVAGKLKITADQKKKMADIQTKQMTKFREMFSGGGRGNRSRGNRGGGDKKKAEGGGRAGRGRGGFDFSAIQKMRDEATKKTMAILTADQTKALEKMKGKDFKIPERRFNFRGRGQRGGGQRKRPTKDRDDL